jgi:DNA processing protein
MAAELHTFSEVFRPLNEAEQKYAPLHIYLEGDISLLSAAARVSIIGSRDASESGLARARKLSTLLVRRGVCIVSGLARGIDTAAHKAAIEAGGRTIGVIGTPIDVCYPKENQRLQTEIAINHLLISQFAPGTPARKGNFPTRNRLMALLSDATVIVEAQDGSGTTHQGWEALRLARPLWILQSAANNPDLKWPQEFLRYGAQVLSDDSFDDLEDSLPSAALTSSDASLSF